MKKIRIANKELLNNNKVLKIGYCQLQYLLEFFTPHYYNFNSYFGWSYDVYVFNNFLICTGYRPVGNYKLKYEDEKEINQEAFRILCNIRLTKKERNEQINKLINKIEKLMIKEN